MIKKIFFTLLTLFLFFFLSAWLYLQTPQAKRYLLKTVTHLIEKTTDHKVKIHSVTFHLPLKLEIRDIEISKDGIILSSIKKIEVSPELDFYKKTLSLHSLTLDNVDIFNFPISNKIDLDIDKNLWDMIPLNISLPSISITNLSIDPKLLPKDFLDDTFPINLNGSIFVDPSRHTLQVKTSIKRSIESDDDNTTIDFELTGDENKEFILSVFENNQGILSYALDLGIPFDTSLKINGIKNNRGRLDGNFAVNFLEDGSTQSTENRALKGMFSYDLNLLEIPSLEGILGDFSATGKASIDTENLNISNAQFDLFIDDLKNISHDLNLDLSGKITSNITLTGNLLDPTIILESNAYNLSVNQRQVNDFLLTAHLAKVNDNLVGKANLQATFNETDFNFSSSLHWNEEIIAFTGLAVDYSSAHIKGNISYLLKQKCFKGNLDSTFDDFNVFNQFIPLESNNAIQGSFNLNTTFDCISSEQDLDLIIDANDLMLEKGKVKKLKLEAQLKNIFQMPIGLLKLSVNDAHYKDIPLETILIETSFNKKTSLNPFKLSLKNTNNENITAEGVGFYSLDNKEFLIKIDTLNGFLKSYPYELNNPLSVKYTPSSFDLSSMLLKLDQGNLELKINYQEHNAYVKANFSKVPLDIFSKETSLPLKGYINGDLLLNGTPDQLTGYLNSKLTELKIVDKAFLLAPLFETEIKAEILKDKVISDVKIIGITKENISTHLEVPLMTSLTAPYVHLDEHGPVFATLNAVGDIAPLLQLLVIDTTSISGNTTLKLELKGSYLNPDISGLVQIKDGTFESLETGAVFKNLNALFEAKGKILTLKELTAIDLHDGKIHGKGVLELDINKKFPFVLNVDLLSISLLNQDFTKAVASGEVKVSGNMDFAKVEGNLKTDSIKIIIPEQAQAISHSVDVKYVNYKEGEILPKNTETATNYPIELDVQIDASQNATIKSKDLSSSWHGNLKISGFTHAPLFFGDFKIIDGQYNFNGKIFDIKDGTISFAGDIDKKTTLYVIASKDLGKIVAEVILKGPVKNPSISFRSNPPLSQREILSYLLFGRGVGDITPFQGSELSQSIKDLTKGKKSKGPDVITQIRNSIGIDQIDINKTEGNESNEVSLQVGKYISKGVLVSVNKSITSEVNQVGIEANLLHNIKCEAQVGDDSSARLQLKWKKDY